MSEDGLFKAPCNLARNNSIELVENIPNSKYPYNPICVRYKCGKIKWKCKGYKKPREYKKDNEVEEW